MKKVKQFILAIGLSLMGTLVFSTEVFARDVYVKGYYRSDGTYVRPHIRSAPDNYKWNNYGPSQRDEDLMNPRARDYDKDGVPNYLDTDDDNDGIYDDWDEDGIYNSWDNDKSQN